MPPFIHLRAKSAYSLLQSALHIEDLARLCVTHQMPALALCDANNLFGALEFSESFAAQGAQPIVGMAIDVKGDAEVGGTLALLAQDEEGYANLMRLSSAAFLGVGAHEAPHLALDRVLEAGNGLIALTGGAEGPLARHLELGHVDEARALLQQLARAFPGRLYVELQRHGLPLEALTEGQLVDLAYELGLPLVATNDVRFEARKDHRSHDALMCIAASSYLGE